MADSMDLVQQRVEETLQRNINNARSPSAAVSSFTCESCGAAIPEARRIAVPGCDLCFTCKQIEELKSKHYNGGAV